MAPSQLDRIENRVNDIYKTVNGDGSNGNPGIKIRVDRLEQDAARRGWFAKTALGIALTALAATIGKWLTLPH